MKRVVVPVDMGGSPTHCAVSAPPTAPPGPDLVAALIEHYRTERMPDAGGALEVAFFRGGLPDAALLEVCRPYPVRVACSPADLSVAEARTLRAAGVATIELDVLTFTPWVLRDCGRGYTSGRAASMLRGLASMGFRVGTTLMPGLPGSSHETALEDAHRLAGPEHPSGVGNSPDGPIPVHFVRILPALAFEHSDLARWASEGRWRHMTLGEAVTTVVEMVDHFESVDLPVARVGLQPGQDVPGRVVAGPQHPNLRGLVEVRRFRSRMAAALAGLPRGSRATVRVNPKDLSWAKGTANENVRALRADFGLVDLAVRADERVERGRVEVA